MNGITSLGEWCDGPDPFVSLALWSLQFYCGLPVMYQSHLTNLDPFRECFSAAHETRFEGCNGCMWECRIAKRTTGKMTGCMRRTRMQMRCTWWHEMKCMTWTKCKTKDKNPTTEEMSYHIAGNGKSWRYKYGMLHPGRYNSPPRQKDLVPRSRTERTPDIRNGGDPCVPR